MTNDRHWRDRAACRNEDPWLFEDPYQSRGGAGVVHARVARAVAFCHRCPVTAECLQEGITNRESAIRGGLVLQHGKIGRYRPRRVPSKAS